MYKGSVVCVLLVLAFACDYSEAQAYSTTIRRRCPGNCVPPGCMCEMPPLPSGYFFKLCLEGERSPCPIRICNENVINNCVRLKMEKRQKQIGTLQYLKSRARRSVRSVNNRSRTSQKFDFSSTKPVDEEVEFCEVGTKNCFPVCTKGITTLCVSYAYDTISKKN